MSDDSGLSNSDIQHFSGSMTKPTKSHASSEGSNQPAHLDSLISLHCVLTGYLRTQRFDHAYSDGSDQNA